MLTTRREMLAGAGALGLAAALPAAPDATTTAAPGDAAAEALLQDMAEALLVECPEGALALGIDKGARAALRSRFAERDHAADRDHAAAAGRRLERLRAIDQAALSPAVALDVEVTRTAHELALEGWRTMPVGNVATFNYSSTTPFVVSQNTGAYLELPDLLENKHAVADAADATAYLARIEAYAAALDGETGRLRADQAAGAILPDFLIDIATKQLTGIRDMPVAEWSIVTSLADKCAKAGLPGHYATEAGRLAREKVVPALGRQVAAFAAVRRQATDAPGVWHVPHGDAYYAWLLKASTTTPYAPDELHRQGVEQNKAYLAEIDRLLKAQGLTQGTVGERMAGLAKRPDLLFTDDDAGRAKLLAYLNGRIADIRPRLPRAFGTLVKGNLLIRRVPPAIQDGMPLGYAGPGSIDGTVPGIYYINLKSTANWPRYALPTLCYHEGIPGHVWQGEYTYRLPLIRTLLSFNAYTEGWALYSEQLADELGVYAGDPLGRIGYLQSMNFRACRLVVDTGIHAKRWGFDQALDWFSTGTGQPREQLRAELNRYCSWPGQACGYKMGHNEINRVRTKAMKALGRRFDLRGFDDAVVMGGNVPLTLLDGVADRYVKTA